LRVEQLESRLNLDARAYVASLYTTILNRTGSNAEINGWVSGMQAGTSVQDVVNGFLDSREYRQIQVNQAYQEVFHRNADTAGLNFWTDRLGDDNNSSTIDLRVKLLQSAEYQSSHASNAAFVQGLYQDLLHRSPDAGQSYWLDLLNNKGESREDVIRIFLRTDERLGNEVDVLYRDYFNRVESQGDRNFWINQLRNNDDDGNNDNGDDAATENIEPFFAGSTEFRAQSGF